MAGMAVGGSVALAGCTTFGTNVSGDFACRAPDGICAPSTVIDDRALAMISGGSPYQPAGPYPVAPTRPGPQMASLAARTTLRPVQVARTDQKVLTVVFPAHVDGQGRLFEATTVRTVVDSGSWSVADAASPVRAVGVPNAVEVGLSASGSTEGAVSVASVDPMIAPDMVPPVLAIDPDIPSAAGGRGSAGARSTTGEPVTGHDGGRVVGGGGPDQRPARLRRERGGLTWPPRRASSPAGSATPERPTRARPVTRFRCWRTGCPYRSYDAKTELFYNTDSIAFAIELAPLMGADERTGEILTQFLSEGIPAAGCLQIMAFQSPRVGETIAKYAVPRYLAGGVHKKIAEHRATFLKSSVWTSISKDALFHVRNHRVFLSFGVKIGRVTTDELVAVRDGITSLLQSINVPFQSMGPVDLIALIDDITSPAGDTLRASDKLLRVRPDRAPVSAA